MSDKSSHIVLHGFAPYQKSISGSPFPIRVELFLRWARVPYTLTFKDPTHPKTGKTPWMEYKGTKIPDSQQIIDVLSRDFGRNPDEALSPQELAVARGFSRMLGEATIFCMLAWNFLLSNDSERFIKEIFIGGFIGTIVNKFVRRDFRKTLWAQGIGRLPPDTIYDAFERDMKAISEYMGNKPFVMGPQISSVDFLLFGMLQIIFATPDYPQALRDIVSKFENLKAYRLNIQGEFFPDWADIVERRAEIRAFNP